jgi:hypothetical protein
MNGVPSDFISRRFCAKRGVAQRGASIKIVQCVGFLVLPLRVNSVGPSTALHYVEQVAEFLGWSPRFGLVVSSDVLVDYKKVGVLLRKHGKVSLVSVDEARRIPQKILMWFCEFYDVVVVVCFSEICSRFAPIPPHDFHC